MDPSSTLSGRNPRLLFEEIKPGGGCNEWCFSLDGLSHKWCRTKEEEKVVSPFESPWSCPSLMQNCDLPPPVKVFAGGADKLVLDSIRTKHISKADQEANRELPMGKNADGNDRVDLMKALQLSQSRARTAEKKASFMEEERDRLSTMFLRESLRFFAYRQWMKLLQLEIAQLEWQKQNLSCSNCNNRDERNKGSPEAGDGENAGSLTWCMTLALCLGIAGVAVACKYFI